LLLKARDMMYSVFARRDLARPALIRDDGVVITAGELVAAAGRVRAALATVPPRNTPRVVVVAVPRSPEYVAAVLGVVSAGAAWLAVDTRQPASRLAALLRDAAPEAMLAADDDAAAALAVASSAPLVRVDRLALWAAPDGDSSAPLAADESDVAYVCATSGSSGAPKLVLGTAAGLLSRCRWASCEMPAADDDVAALRTPPVFVDAAAELFAPLLAGVPLAIVPPAADSDPVALAALLAARRVTRLTMLPSLLAAALPALERAPLRIRLLLCSGEPLPSALAEAALRTFPGVRLLNIYGCTEVGADATAYDVSAEGVPPAGVPIGRPLPGVWCAVLGADGAPVREAGERGELLVGGVGVALGYLNAPELTAERFPLASDGRGGEPQRAHRTGDLAAWTPSGALVLHGRADAQVKVRGQRVDLAEVEATLCAHPKMSAAAARAWPPLRLGDLRIAAYVVLDADDHDAAVAELRSWLAQRLLPAAMPVAFTILDSLPCTHSGKVDRNALPEPCWVTAAMSGDEPSAGALEVQLCAAFAVELGLSASVGAESDFFALGGTSLSAAALCARLALSLQALLDHPTPRSLASSGLVAHAALTQQPVARSRDDDSDMPRPAKRLRLPAQMDEAVPRQSLGAAWAPALALSFAGRCDAVGKGATPAAAPPVIARDAPADLFCAWRVPLHACVDASPLLLLPAGSGTSWRAIVGSHAHTAVCVDFDADGTSPRVLWTANVGCVTQEAAFRHCLLTLFPRNSARVEGAAAALMDGSHVAVGSHDGGVSFLRLSDGGLSGRFTAAGAIKAALACDSWTGRVWGASHGRDAFALDGPPRCSAAWQCSLDGAVSAPPSFDATRRRVYFATLAGSLVAVDDPAGGVTAEAWRARVGAAVFGAPAVAACGLVIVSTVEGELRAFAAADGKLTWSVAAGTGPLFAAPTLIADGALAVIGTHERALLCVCCADGAVRWRLPLSDRVAAAAAVDAAEQLITVATVAGDVHVLSLPPAGQPTVIASARLPAEAFSAPVLHSGTLLLGCRDDWLYCLRLRATLQDGSDRV
jgi:amino acid adenylation domain-containing protein